MLKTVFPDYKSCSSVVKKAIRDRRIENIKFLKQGQYITRDEIVANDLELFVLACTEGVLDIVMYFIEEFGITRKEILTNNCRAIRWTAEYGQTDVIGYIANTYKITRDDLVLFYMTCHIDSETIGYLKSLDLL